MAKKGTEKMKKLRLSPTQMIAVVFAGIIFLGTVLLTLPAASRDGTSAGFLPSLFTATSTTQKRQSGRYSLPTQQKGFRRPSNFGGLPFPKQRLPGLCCEVLMCTAPLSSDSVVHILAPYVRCVNTFSRIFHKIN